MEEPEPENGEHTVKNLLESCMPHEIESINISSKLKEVFLRLQPLQHVNRQFIADYSRGVSLSEVEAFRTCPYPVSNYPPLLRQVNVVKLRGSH